MSHHSLLHRLLSTLTNKTTNNYLIQYIISLRIIENKVQLAHIPKIFIQTLHIKLNPLQCNQLIIRFIHAENKIQWCVTPEYQLTLTPLHYITTFRITFNDLMCCFCYQTLALILRRAVIKLHEACLTHFINQQDKVYHIVEWSISLFIYIISDIKD